MTVSFNLLAVSTRFLLQCFSDFFGDFVSLTFFRLPPIRPDEEPLDPIVLESLTLARFCGGRSPRKSGWGGIFSLSWRGSVKASGREISGKIKVDFWLRFEGSIDFFAIYLLLEPEELLQQQDSWQQALRICSESRRGLDLGFLWKLY